MEGASGTAGPSSPSPIAGVLFCRGGGAPWALVPSLLTKAVCSQSSLPVGRRQAGRELAGHGDQGLSMTAKGRAQGGGSHGERDGTTATARVKAAKGGPVGGKDH